MQLTSIFIFHILDGNPIITNIFGAIDIVIICVLCTRKLKLRKKTDQIHKTIKSER